MRKSALAAVRHFNRFELKYVIHRNVAERFKSSIQPYMSRDPHLLEGESYRVNSVYFDSDDLMAFWEKVDGIKFRRKVRIRHYGTAVPDEAYIEIKQRIDRTIQKRRSRFAYASLISSLVDNRDWPAPTPVLDEARLLCYSNRLQPRILISYDRDAYFGDVDPGLRVTFDTNCRFCRDRLFDPGPIVRRPYFLHPAQTILEVKFNHLVPGWLVSMIRRFDMTTQRVSKYCQGINHGLFGGTAY